VVAVLIQPCLAASLTGRDRRTRRLASSDTHGGELITIRPDGTHRRSVWSVPDTAFASAWSPSGDAIAFSDSQNGLGIYLAGPSTQPRSNSHASHPPSTWTVA
jgi:hypothetical protein